MENTKLLGRWGEEQAAAYLKKKRWKIVGLNYTSRFGEIDLIAENKEFIAFVEVKTRKSDVYAQAREFVTKSKQTRILSTAQLWLQSNPCDKQLRFDVIEVYAPEGMKTRSPEVHHIENAFM